MKILATMRAGRVVRQMLYSPRDPNPNRTRRKMSISKEDKLKANLKTSYEKFLMLTYANFSPGDLFVSFSYDDLHLPDSREGAIKCFRKFMRLFRKYRKKYGDPLVYAYCTQVTTENGGRRLHHHMLLRYEDESDIERIKTLWDNGFADILWIKDMEHLSDRVGYMTREPRVLGVRVPGEQMWTTSRGMVRPKFEYITINSDSADINIPTGCVALEDPVQMPGYGGYKSIIYMEPI